MSQYFKKRKNKIGLGKGVEVNSTTFTDKDIEGCDPKILKRVIELGWIEVLSNDAVSVMQNKGKSEEIKTLEELVKSKDELISALEVTISERDAEIVKLKMALYKGWDELGAEELATEFTLDELKDIAVNFCGLELPGNIKEKGLSEKIYEAVQAGSK